MPKQIILLTGDTEYPILSGALKKENESLDVIHADSKKSLQRIFHQYDVRSNGTRMISFSSNVLVPGEILNCLVGPAYNFHPGPPEYPGSHPDSFAIYDGTKRFGATVHEMVEKVDAGPIVRVSDFEIPGDIKILNLAAMAYQHIVSLFYELAAYFANVDEPLPRMNRKWGARKTAVADFERMKILDELMSAEEIALRKRAFWE